MTPAEAVAHVCEADKCSADAAKKIIQFALDEHKIPKEWTDSQPQFLENSYNYYQGLEFPGPEIDRRFAGVKITNWDTGTAHDLVRRNQNAQSKAKAEKAREKASKPLLEEQRPVLLLRAGIEGIWPTNTANTRRELSPRAERKSAAEKKKAKTEKILEAAQKLISSDNAPAQITWLKFNEKVRTEVWGTGKGPIPRGYSDDTIENLVRPFLEGK